MTVERARAGTNLIDVLDRVLDKGIVVEAHVRASPGGIDLESGETRIVVEAIDTRLEYPESVCVPAGVARPPVLPENDQSEIERLRIENAELRRRLEEAE
jgi:hypothetical protein